MVEMYNHAHILSRPIFQYWIKMHTQFFCLLILPPSFEGLAVLCTLFSDIFFLFLYFSEHGAGICDFRLDK